MLFCKETFPLWSKDCFFDWWRMGERPQTHQMDILLLPYPSCHIHVPHSCMTADESLYATEAGGMFRKVWQTPLFGDWICLANSEKMAKPKQDFIGWNKSLGDPWCTLPFLLNFWHFGLGRLWTSPRCDSAAPDLRPTVEIAGVVILYYWVISSMFLKNWQPWGRRSEKMLQMDCGH